MPPSFLLCRSGVPAEVRLPFEKTGHFDRVGVTHILERGKLGDSL